MLSKSTINVCSFVYTRIITDNYVDEVFSAIGVEFYVNYVKQDKSSYT